MAQITQCRMRLRGCILELVVEADEPFVTVCGCAFCADATTPEEGFFKKETTVRSGSRCWEGVFEFVGVQHHIDDILVSVAFPSGGKDSVSLQDVPAEWTRCETGQESVERQIAMLRQKTAEQVRWFRDNMLPLYTWRTDDPGIAAVMAEADRLIEERGASEQPRS